MINVGICDDDLVFASKIETMLIEISKSQLIEMNIEVYSDGGELWRDIQNHNMFDLLYLDIEMLQLNGIDVARKIREKDMDVIIIYISDCRQNPGRDPGFFLNKYAERVDFSLLFWYNRSII